MLTMMAAIAQMERQIIRERREDGVARARAEGKHMGRPRETDTALIRKVLAKHNGNVSAAARELDVSRQTVMWAREIK